MLLCVTPMRVSLPASDLDRAPLASSALVGVLALAAGLGIARWTVRPAPPSSGAPPDGPLAAEAEGPEEGAPEGGPEPAATIETAAGTPNSVEPEGAAIGEPAPSDAETATPAVAPAPSSAIEAAASTPSSAPPSAGPPRGTLLRGRVAYLRCEEGASGSACARDAAIEAAVWAAIDALPTCATAPTSPGHADVVVELGDAVEVRSRDTFAGDVVRLDAAATLGCLASLSSDPALGASGRRLVLSFRFRLE